MSSISSSPTADLSPLSFSEKLGIAFTIPYVLRDIFFHAAIYPFLSASDKNPSFTEALLCQALRSWPARTSLRQWQSTNATSTETYNAYCKAKKIKPNTITLSDGTQAHWLGDPAKADKVVVYTHSGGYVGSLASFHLQVYWEKLVKPFAPQVAMLILAYDIAPAAPFPRQLEQLIDLLNHLANPNCTPKPFPPSSTLLLGDSAGGHLILSLLTAILHPDTTPHSVGKYAPSEPFLGIALVSPQPSFTTAAPSYQKYKHTDCIDLGTLKTWRTAVVPWLDDRVTVVPLAEPARAPPGHWGGVEGLAERVFVAAGEREMIRDDIVVVQERLLADGKWREGALTSVVGNGEPHDMCLIQGIIGGKCDSSVALESWFKSVLGG